VAVEPWTEVATQHLLGRPRDGPFGGFRVRELLIIGHASIGEQDGNAAQATGGCPALPYECINVGRDAGSALRC
jgi:hypothetical protein